MSTFYVMPPRPALGGHFVRFLQDWFPGLDWQSLNYAELAETIAAIAGERTGTYIIFREDLPEGHDLHSIVVEDFGAAVGDEIVEVIGSGKCTIESVLGDKRLVA